MDLADPKMCDPKKIVSIGNHLNEPLFFYAGFVNCNREEFLFEASKN